MPDIVHAVTPSRRTRKAINGQEVARGHIEPVSLTIANGTATTGAYQSRGACMFGMVLPSSFTGANMTFTVSHDGITYQALYDYTGSVVTMAVAASRSYDLPGALCAWPFFKCVSDANEAATRTIIIVAKG